MRSITFLVILTCSSLWIVAQPAFDTDSTNGIFGIGCGLVGAPQNAMMRTIKLVNNFERDELHKLISSDNPQAIIHGYIGLYFLQQNGVRLTEPEIIMMQNIRNLEVEVTYCQGCSFGLKERLNKLITPKQLRGYYSWYANFGYKKTNQP